MIPALPTSISLAQNSSATCLADIDASWKSITLALSPSALTVLQRALNTENRVAHQLISKWLDEACVLPWFWRLDHLLLSKVDDEKIYLSLEVIEGLKRLNGASQFILEEFFSALLKHEKGTISLNEIQCLLGQMTYFQDLERDRNIHVSNQFWSLSYQPKHSYRAPYFQIIERVAAFTWRNLLIDLQACKVFSASKFDISNADQRRLAEHIIDGKIQNIFSSLPRSNPRVVSLLKAYGKKFIAFDYDEELFAESMQGCRKLVDELGSDVLEILIERPLPASQKEAYLSLKLLQTILEYADDIDVEELLKLLGNHEKSTQDLIDLFRKLCEPQIEQAKDIGSIEDQEQSFMQFDKAEIDREKNKILNADFVKIHHREERYKKMSSTELKKAARLLGQEKNDDSTPCFESLLSLLAIGRIAIHRLTGKYPYAIQMLTVLQMLKGDDKDLRGVIAQVRTGEGKSICVGLLALCLALQNQSVDIITSSRYLAKRDQSAMAPLFGYFDISSSQICEDHPPDKLFDGQILFGINTDFEFAYLRQLLDRSPPKNWSNGCAVVKRAFSYAIVDEADNLFIDLAFNSARIAVNMPNSFQRAYLPIYRLVEDRKLEVSEALNGDETKWPLLLKDIQSLLSQHRAWPGEFDQLESKELFNKLKTWVKSAYIARYCKQIDIDYVIKDDGKRASQDRLAGKIVIVDRENSGRLHEASRWQAGIHEFLEVKHGLQIASESSMPASISHSTYFSFYKKIFGLTGTLGSSEEQKELEGLYTISTFSVPSRKVRQYKQLPFTVVPQDKFFEALRNEIINVRDQNRPSLILMDSIETTQTFSDYLLQNDCHHLMLNEQQVMSEDQVITLAGHPEQVTIATNTAGRGTDIVPLPICLGKGGLHVVFSFYPINDRVENQGFGRAARQGQMGSGRFLLSSEDPAIKDIVQIMGKRFFHLDHQEQLALLKEQRLQKVAQLCKKRSIRATMERLHHASLETFLNQVDSWTNQIQVFNWSERTAFSSKLCDENRTENFVKENSDTSSQSQFGLKIYLCKLYRAQSKSEFATNINMVIEELRSSFYKHWSEHFYSKLDSLSQYQDESSFNGENYQNELTNFYDKSSKKWTPTYCNCSKNINQN